jgi:hypothetical protein
LVSILPTTPACTRMASCKPPTVFCQRERAHRRRAASVADIERDVAVLLLERLVDLLDVEGDVLRLARSCCVRWTFC